MVTIKIHWHPFSCKWTYPKQSLLVINRLKTQLSIVHDTYCYKRYYIGGGGGGGNFLYMASYGSACRIAPFFSAARYMIGPLFLTKGIWMVRFFWIPMWKAPLFWHPGICTYIFFAQRFSRLLVLLVFNEFCVIFVELPAINGNKKLKGQYMNGSIFRIIKYMNGSVFSKARYVNGVGFEILARIPVQKLSPLPLPPTHPHPTRAISIRFESEGGWSTVTRTCLDTFSYGQELKTWHVRSMIFFLIFFWTLTFLTHHENMPIYFWPPQTPLLYSKTGVYRGYIIFLLLLKNIDWGYSLEPPRRCGSALMSTHNLCYEQKYEKIAEFLSENFQYFGAEIFFIFE